MVDEIVFIEREEKEPSEADVQDKIRKYLKTRVGWEDYKASDRYKKGVSDIIGCFYGFLVAIEIKRNQQAKATKHQLDFIERMVNVGGFGTIAWNVGMVEKFLDTVELEISRRTNGLYKTFLKINLC